MSNTVVDRKKLGCGRSVSDLADEVDKLHRALPGKSIHFCINTRLRDLGIMPEDPAQREDLLHELLSELGKRGGKARAKHARAVNPQLQLALNDWPSQGYPEIRAYST